jgi:Tol biopolymer transport system component
MPMVSLIILATGISAAQNPQSPTEAPARVPTTVRQVWIGPPPADRDDTWAVSADGNLLAYRDEQSRLALFDFRSNRKHSLGVDVPADQWRLVLTWSRDGSRLAYNRRAEDGRMQIQVIPVAGGAPKVIAERRTYAAPLVWSADGDRLLIAVEQGANDEVSWVPVGAGAATVIKRLDGSRRSGWRTMAVLSPDGQFLALPKIADGGETRDVIVMRLDGTRVSAVVEHPADDYPAGWTAEGNQLLFISDRSGSVDLWALPMTDGTPRDIAQRIRRDVGLVQPLGLTTSGALFYAINLSMSDVYTVELDSLSGQVLGTPRPVASRFAGYNSAPDISPDGQEIVYQIGRPGSPDGIHLLFQSLRERRERSIRPQLRQFSRPRYDPRGGSVAVHGISTDGTQGIYRVDNETGEVALLVASPSGDLSNPGWSRDGRVLFFERGEHTVSMLDRQGGQTRDVYRFSTSAANFTSSPSPDGRTLAVVHGVSLYVVDVASGRARELLRLHEPEQFHGFPGSLAWMPDGHTILFGKSIGDQRQLWRVSDRGLALEWLGLLVERRNLYFLRTSPDGRRIAFVIGDYDIRPHEVWVLENFLPRR